MGEAVKVIVRCRPMNTREKDLKCKPCVFMDSKIYQCSLANLNDPTAPPKAFTFDGCYYTDSTTEALYNEIAYPLVEGVLEGYNGTVFAYGQTGCGKSFTMQGVTNPPTQRGIIPRAFEHIFEAIDASENMKYLVHASYLEIYNEDIHDLLGHDSKKKLDLKEHPDKGVYVPDITMHPVHNTAECEKLMDKGWNNRSTGATLMNADSSRSHSIFTINIEMMGTAATPDGEQHIRKGKLNLVDLAGSERQAKTQASGDRLKEATKINLSLSALGNVISALVDGKSKHIPYRDSKLTRLLQDSLGGNTKTLMVACLSPADNNYDETLSTLRYANRAKNIKNKPKINEDPKDAMLREFQEEIQKLKELLEKQPQGAGGVPVITEELLEEERQRMRSEYESEMEELRKKMASEKETKAKMQSEIDKMRLEYEEKMKSLEQRAQTAKLQRGLDGQIVSGAAATAAITNGMAVVAGVSVPVIAARSIEQQEAMMKLKQIQEQMIQGGRKAGDKDLKEKRKLKKKAAENRLKVLGEALGHVDDEDGVLVQVYDDIQEELRVKTEALKKSKLRVKALTSELSDTQAEFQGDRDDYLETIRNLQQQEKLLLQIIDKIQPTIRKDSNYANIEKIKAEAIWNDETQRWKIPELTFPKTKLPPAGHGGRFQAVVNATLLAGSLSAHSAENQAAPAEEPDPSPVDDFNGQILQQKLAKSEEENVAGNYFKPQRASKLVAQAQQVQKSTSSSRSSAASNLSVNAAITNNNNGSNLTANSNLSSSFNSGLNTFGLNNSYATTSVGHYGGGGSGGGIGGYGAGNARNRDIPSWLGHSSVSNGIGNSTYASDLMRKPTRLEALPTVDKMKQQRKRSGPGGPILNTMGTF